MLYGARDHDQAVHAGLRAGADLRDDRSASSAACPRNVIVQGIYRVYLSIITGVPSLLVIFLIYYGGSAMLTGLFGKSRSYRRHALQCRRRVADDRL